MAYTPFTTVETASNEFWSQSKARKVKDNFDYLYSIVGANSADQIPNSGFEIATGGTGLGADPDNWDWSGYPAGTRGIDSTNMGEGQYCHYAIHPGGAGNGGGALTSDYIACSEYQSERISVLHYASAAGMKNQVNLLWYDEDKVALTGGDVSTQLYSSTANSTSWVKIGGSACPPTGARFFKVQLVSGYTDTNVAGTAYWDNVKRGSSPTWLFEAGDDVVIHFDYDGLTHAETAYTPVLEYLLPHNVFGELRIAFRFVESTVAKARIYRRRDGSLTAVGTERTTGGVYSQDIDGWLPGDGVVIQMYVYGGDTGTVSEFSISGNRLG